VQSVCALLASFDYVSSHIPLLFLSFAVVSAFAEARPATAAEEHGHDPSKDHQHQARDGTVRMSLDEENN
jgi:hypothetical protein